MSDEILRIYKSTLTGIANAIRTKNPDVSGLIPTTEMKQDILDIPTKIMEELDVTENGTYVAGAGKAYGTVIVNVEGYKLEDMPTGAIATITDAAALLLNDLKVSIEPVQAGSGDPSPHNERPISGWTECNLSDVSVNLFDKSKAIDGKKVNSSTGAILNNNTWAMSDYISVPQNTTLYTNADGTNQDYVVTLYDKEKNYIGYKSITSNASFSTDNAYFVILSTIKSRMSVDEMVLNYPSTDTSYHAYQGNTYNIQFPSEAGTVYGGTLDVTNGTLTVDRAMVDMGSLSYTYYQYGTLDGGYTDGLASVIKKPIGSSYVTKSICSELKEVQDYAFDNAGDDVYSINAYGRIKIHYDGVSTGAELKTAMNGVKLVYELATPVTYQLDPTMIRLLENNNNIFADTGDVLEGEYFVAL